MSPMVSASCRMGPAAGPDVRAQTALHPSIRHKLRQCLQSMQPAGLWGRTQLQPAVPGRLLHA